MSSLDHDALYEQFSRSPWLAHIGQPEQHAKSMGSRDEMMACIEDDPDAFYAPPYETPYEDWCGEDHQRAAALASDTDPDIVKLSRQAHLQAWDHCPDAEICGLLADDVETIATLLMHQQALGAFTLQRIAWYIKGRMPWGYQGEFPDGQWLVL
jgi:hypothetical protein